jgi:hypothetical protein
MLLVLESARVEVAVLLNELAYLKYESSKTSQTDEAICQKQRNLAILFSLIEKIIKMISNASSGEGMFPFSCVLLFHGHQTRKLRVSVFSVSAIQCW